MGTVPAYDSIQVGQDIPPLTKPVVTREQVARFADASGDRNPIHLDDAAAKAGGLPGIIVHGMLNMAFLGQVLTQWVPQHQIRSFGTRFTAMAFPGDVITCRGKVTGKTVADGEKRVELAITAENQKGEMLLSGQATVALA